MKSAQHGVVALITTIVIGLLLVVISTSAIALMSRELRQASDFDQSAKAFFAAESGVEDAIAVIRRGLKDNGKSIEDLVDSEKPGGIGDCTPYTAGQPSYAGGISNNLDGLNNISYTCQIVSTFGNQVEDVIKTAGAGLAVDLNGITDPNFQRVKLSWNRANTGDPQNWGVIPAGFPAGNSWIDGSGKPVPAVMEAAIISYPSSGNFSSSDITLNTIVFKPVNSGGSTTTPISTTPSSQPVLVNCVSGNEYACSIEVTGFSSGRSHVISLQTRYRGAYFKVEACKASCSTGNILQIPDAQLIIDVTGKAGSVFRRVQIKAPLGPQTKFPLFTLLADDEICKYIEVLRSAGTDQVITGSERGCEDFD